MARVDEYLELIDDPSHPPLERPHPDDEVLLGLLVHLAFSDGIVQGDEFALLKRVRPDLDDSELMMWAMELAPRGMSPEALREVLPDPDARWAGLRLAARMVCLDGDVADEEVTELQRLTEILGLAADAPGRAVDEIVARVEAEPGAVTDALRNMFWDTLLPDRDELSSDLAEVVPDGVDPVCRVLLHDETEVAGIFAEGLAARFDDGPAFVRWDAIERYTRVPVPGAAFHLHTSEEDHSMSDPRLRDVGALLDVVYGRRPVHAPED